MNVELTKASTEPDYFPLRVIRSYALTVGKKAEVYPVFPLYVMRGLAPTYWNGQLGGKYKNVTMNWFRDRLHPLRINYTKVFGQENYDFDNVLAVNQLFLGEEAYLFKVWMDDIYPEENTAIYPVMYPITENPGSPPHGVWEDKKGSFHCFDGRWTYDWLISYWVDVSECEFVGTER